MKTCNYIWGVAVTLGWLLGGSPAFGQSESLSPEPADTGTTPTVDAENTVEGRVVAPVKSTDLDTTILGFDVTRPTRVERQELPAEIRERLLRFERYRRAYLERQEELRKELMATTDEERARVREQLQRLREAWLERTRELREEFKDRQRELAIKLKEHSDVIRSTRDEARDAVRDQLLDQKEQLREQLNQEGRER